MSDKKTTNTKPTPIEALLKKYNFKFVQPPDDVKHYNDVYELTFKKYRVGAVVGTTWLTVYRCSQPQLIDVMHSRKITNLESCEALIEWLIDPMMPSPI